MPNPPHTPPPDQSGGPASPPPSGHGETPTAPLPANGSSGADPTSFEHLPPYGAGPPQDGQPAFGSPPPPPRRRRGVKLLAGTAALALLLGGGGWAFYAADPLQLFEAGPQAAEAIPDEALFYLGLDADPSAKQKIEAVRFLNHFPYFEEHAGLDDEDSDVRALVVEEALDTFGCSGVSYDDSVKPWLGDKFGFALMAGPGSGAEPIPLIVIESTDDDRARTGLADLAECGQQVAGEEFGYALEGGYVVIAETQALAEEHATNAQDSSLADNDDFRADMGSLGDLGVVTMWADIAGLDASTDEAMASAVPPVGMGLLSSTYERAAATIRFTSGQAEFATSIYGRTSDISHGENAIVDLPDSTVFAMSEAGGANRLEASWDDIVEAAASEGVDVEAEIADFEAETGFTLPNDVQTLLGDNLMLAIDSEGISAASLDEGDLTSLDIGVRFTNDPAELEALYDKIMAAVSAESGGDLPVVKVEADDGLVIATNDAYGQRLADLGGGLGDSAAFQSVLDDAGSKEFVLFFNMDLVEDQLASGLDDGSARSGEVLANLKVLQAIGVSSETDGDYTVGTMRVSVND